jgi:PKD repeat protein
MSVDADTLAFEAALAGRTPSDEEIASLLAFADRLVELAAQIEPRAGFSTSLRGTLVADASATLTVATPPRSSAAPVGAARVLGSVWGRTAAQSRRRLAILLACFVAALALVGVSSASASALPGDALYPAKRIAEGVQLSLKRGDSAQGTFLLELAMRRLEEVNGLVRRTGAPSDVEAATLDDYSDQTDDGADSLLKSFRATDSRDDIVSLNRFATEASKRLEALDGEVSGPAVDSLQAAQSQLSSIVGLATDLCPDCGGINARLATALTKSSDASQSTDAPDAAAPAAPVPTPSSTQPTTPSTTQTTTPASPPAITPIVPIGETNDDEQDEADGNDDDDTSDSDRRRRREQSQAEPAPLPAPVPVPVAVPTPTLTALPPAEGKRFHCDYGVGANARTITCTLDHSGHPLWQFRWDFGDGQTSTGRQVQHTYAGPGSYTVKLVGTLGFDLLRDQTTVTIR